MHKMSIHNTAYPGTAEHLLHHAKLGSEGLPVFPLDAQQSLEEAITPKYPACGKAGGNYHEHAWKNNVRIVRQFQDGHHGRQRRVQYGAHHSSHAKDDIKAYRAGRCGHQCMGDRKSVVEGKMKMIGS